MRSQQAAYELHAPDWENVIASDDYKVWLATQPKETQERATTTPRACELAPILAGFKTWKGVSGPENGPQPGATGGWAHAARASRVVLAQVTPNELDEFRAGFKSVRGG